MKLLLAVDTINTLNIILDQMTTRSWPTGTEARVLSVVEDEEIPPETWRKEGYGVAAVQREMRNRGEQLTALAVERLRAIGISAEVKIKRGVPAFLIASVARTWSADLILIRAHNRTDFRNLMLGSVAKSVVKSAHCSVEVIRAADQSASVGDDNFKILLATDGSDQSLAAAHVVAQTNWPEDTQVKVVSVLNPLVYSMEEIGLTRGIGTERAHRAIGEAMKVLKNSSLKVSGEVIAGRTTHGIINRAQNWRADLIVLGTHDRRGLERLLTGSTAEAVANRAHCSVWVVRDRDVHEESVAGNAIPSSQNKSGSDRGLGSQRAA